MPKFLYKLVPFLAACCLATGTAAEEWRYDNVERVVAISDIHGAYDAMVETLQRASILGDDLQWAGDSAHLIIVGDILDRGPDSRTAMDLLMRLEDEASAAGGQVQVLIGNHESMLLIGDMRYVSDAEYAAFAGDANEEERAHWLQHFAGRAGLSIEEATQQFDERYPVGYFAMRRAFRPDGQYGSWLLQKNILAVVNRTAFVHGGLSPLVEPLGGDGLNQQLREILGVYTNAMAILNAAAIILPTDSHYDYGDLLDQYVPPLDADQEVLDAVAAMRSVVDADLLSSDGPLWYRLNIYCQPLVEEYRLAAALASIDADRLVVGHTPTPNRQVLQRFDGRLIEIDTGMLNNYYRGMGHALVIEGDQVSIAGQDGAEDEVPQAHMRRVGRRAGTLSTESLEALLRDGAVQSVEQVAAEGRSRQTIVTVTGDAGTVRALFDESSRKGVHPGAAAYALDRLLGLNMVPVTVVRDVDGDTGSLQFLPDNIVDESERSASGEGGGASCPLSEQWPAMSVFDVLVYNEGRTLQSILYDRSSWNLILGDHGRAFPTKKGRPPHLKKSQLDLHAGWVSALSDIADDVIDSELGDVLDRRRLNALKSRRDELLNEATQQP